jgi:hypothetical protein
MNEFKTKVQSIIEDYCEGIEWLEFGVQHFPDMLDRIEKEALRMNDIKNTFIAVSAQQPPRDIELLAKSPSGTIHICQWRPEYDIFTCQTKIEKSWNWEWKLI